MVTQKHITPGPHGDAATGSFFGAPPVHRETANLRMIKNGDRIAPAAPVTIEETGITADVLSNLALKLAYTVPKFDTQWAAEQLCLPLALTADILEELRADNLIEALGRSGPIGFNFAITGRGCDRADRLLQISGYVGPAPVSLEAYNACLEWQFERVPQPHPDQVAEALSDLVLNDETVQIAGLAAMSRRGLFLHGPPGNGKTCLGHLLHNAVEGDLWIPHCIGIDNNIIRVFDPECHDIVDDDSSTDSSAHVDRRWIQIKRPFIVVGGELTVESLDLIFSPSHRFYEAPLHFKANGGTFLLDDFGCQRATPEQLLNRWIHPLERGVDFLTLQTGQQLTVPFRQMLIVSTNLDPDAVMTPAFLRRMGYRVHMDNLKPDRYRQVFRRYADGKNLEVPPDLVDSLLARYEAEDRPRRGCEPRDLIERVCDLCRYLEVPTTLKLEYFDQAWHGYFGNAAVATHER